MRGERGFISVLALLLLAALLLLGLGLQAFLQRQQAQNELHIQQWRLGYLADAALMQTAQQLTTGVYAQALPDKRQTVVQVRETQQDCGGQPVQLRVALRYQPQLDMQVGNRHIYQNALCYEIISTARYRGHTGIIGAERRAVVARKEAGEGYVWLGYVP